MQNGKITIYDIAKEADVSPATVSRILNGNSKVSAEKKARVQEIVSKYNFVPNAMAKGLSNSETKTIGVLLSDIRNPFYSSFYVGVETAAIKQGYTVILCNALNDEENERRHLEMLTSNRVDVLILAGGRTDDVSSNSEHIKYLNRISQTLPIIAAGKIRYFNCSTISMDNRPGMEALMAYLIGLGHKRFAMIGGRRKKTPTYIKQEMMREILQRNNLPICESWIVDTPAYDAASGYKAAERLLRRPGTYAPTALLGINEEVAMGIIQAVRDLGLQVPQDISVAGFDNTYFSDLCSPSLTSAGCMYDDYGTALMNLVTKVVHDPALLEHLIIPTGLTVRKSCAIAKQND